MWKQLFAKKSLEMLQEEMKGENRLRRVLGPVGLTSLGIGAIIGAGIFVMTGRVAAQIHEVLPAKEIIKGMVNDAARILKHNASLVNPKAKL